MNKHATKNIYKSFLLALLFLLMGSHLVHLNGQCTQRLDSATVLYNQGIIDVIPALLDSCIIEGFTNEQRITALKLVIMSYLIDDNQAGAETSMRFFLKNYPNYEVRLNDPLEFSYLYESFRTVSVFSLGFIAGSTYNIPVVSTYYSLNTNESPTKVNPGSGYAIGLSMGKYITSWLETEMDLIYGTHQYTFIDEGFEFGEVIYEETADYLHIPLIFNFELRKKAFVPYVFFGGGMHYFFNYTGSPSVEFTSLGNDVQRADFDISNSRNSIMYSALGGFGARLKTKSGIFFMRAAYLYGLSPIINESNRYNNQDIWTKYYHVDDDYTLTQINLSAGYIFNFYKIEKFR